MNGTGPQTLDASVRVATNFPNSWEAQNLAATVQEALSNFDKAVPYRLKQLQLDPNNWVPRFSLAVDYEKSNKLNLARSEYQRIIDLAPNSPEATNATANLKKMG